MATYGYVRVSTGRQAEDGESLDVQKRQIEGYAKMQGLKLDDVFIERGVSGSKPLRERKRGAALLETLEDGDVVVTAKLDRMFRSSLDALDNMQALRDRRISVHMIDLGGDVTGNGVSNLVFTILSAVAEAERDRIRERIVDVKRDQRERGRYLGGIVPFGYSLDAEGNLIKKSEEQRAIKTMVELRRRNTPYRKIADAMKEMGFNLSHAGVAKIVATQMANTAE